MKCLYGFALFLSLAVLGNIVGDARELSGKVMAVYHEPVVINTKTMDKVSVSVRSCLSGQWETVSYSPGVVSDDNSLGFLYRDLSNAGRSVVSKNQYMNSVSGHVTLVVNDQSNTVEKTTFWGYNWECGRDIEGQPAGGGVTGNTAPLSTAPVSNGGGMMVNPINKLRKLGF